MSKKYKFKVGDRVKIVSAPSFNLNLVGCLGTVLSIDQSDDTYRVGLDDGGGKWWFYEHHLEAVEERKEVPPPSPSAPPRYKIGDKVRVKSREWYERNKDAEGYVRIGVNFAPKMATYCGEVHVIAFVDDDGTFKFENNDWWWTSDFVEPVEAEPKEHSGGVISAIKRAITPTPVPFTGKLPLLKSAQLLTNIKLD